MPEEMAIVARATSIPIATGERLTTKYEFARVLQHRAASILQLALGRVGGLLEAKKIAGMAEAHYAQVAPHLIAARRGCREHQLSACIPNFLILESIETWGGFHASFSRKPIRWEDGYVIPPSDQGSASSSTKPSRSPIRIAATSSISRWPTTRSREFSRNPTAKLARSLFMTSYAFIGVGHLGAHLAGSLLREGFPLTVNDISKERAEPLLAQGRTVGRFAKGGREPVRGCDHLSTIANRLRSRAVRSRWNTRRARRGQHLDRDEHGRPR
jgi:hypothetical protein